MVERLFFAVAVAFEVPGVLVAMIGWIAAKIAVNWGEYARGQDLVGAKNRHFTAIMSGLVSMFIALIAGLILRHWKL